MTHITIFTSPNGVNNILEGKIPDTWSYHKEIPNIVELKIDEKTFKKWQSPSNLQLLKD